MGRGLHGRPGRQTRRPAPQDPHLRAPLGKARPRTTPPPSTSPTNSRSGGPANRDRPCCKVLSQQTHQDSHRSLRCDRHQITVRPHSRARRPHKKRRRPLPRTIPASSPHSTAPPPPATSPPRSSTLPTTAHLPTFSSSRNSGSASKTRSSSSATAKTSRGIKTYIAQQYGAKGVLIYSDPADDGYFRGDVYPKGPWRPDSAVQRGSVQFLPIYPGDPTTPGIAATPDLPSAKRIPADKLQANQPSIPTNRALLSRRRSNPQGPRRRLAGVAPASGKGALPFTYHLGASAKNANLSPESASTLHLEYDIALRTI